ncbi:MAG: polyphenol oxidase family protein, partial [Candidatus Binatia bacterium]
LIPPGWLGIEGLMCGFGDRQFSAPTGTILLQRQVHGKMVVAAPADGFVRGDDDYPRAAAEADALIAACPATIVGVRTADCVPLLLVAPRARWSAAVHAGWRGTVAGIAAEAVRAASGAGIAPGELLAALGPSIGPCCYEVSEEVGSGFEQAGLPVVAPRSPGSKPHLDLREANRVLLERDGVPPGNIQSVGPCTRCRSDLYHSFRAQPQSPGRQISWVGWREPADQTHARDREPRR